MKKVSSDRNVPEDNMHRLWDYLLLLQDYIVFVFEIPSPKYNGGKGIVSGQFLKYLTCYQRPFE